MIATIESLRPLAPQPVLLTSGDLERLRDKIAALESKSRPLPYAPEPNLEEDTSTHD